MKCPDRRIAALGVLALAAASPLLLPGPAGAQQPSVPSDPALEILVKQTLLTFNDANLTGNYAIFYATLADAFRRQFTEAQVRDAFREFNQQQIDLAGIIINRFRLTRPAAINANGALDLDGRFDTRPFNIVFQLAYLPGVGGEWRLAHLNVSLVPHDQGQAGAPSRGPKGRM